MAQYVCSVCGYVYDEDKEGVNFSELKGTWRCPLCGASKQQFYKKEEEVKDILPKIEIAEKKPSQKDSPLSYARLCLLCTNLAKGCEKQYMAEEAALFNELAAYYKKHGEKATETDFEAVRELLNEDLSKNYPAAFAEAKEDFDRGALRALTWSEKVSKTVGILLDRYKKDGSAFLSDAKIYVCEICGFIYIGNDAPEICPICKVPKLKIREIGRV